MAQVFTAPNEITGRYNTLLNSNLSMQAATPGKTIANTTPATMNGVLLYWTPVISTRAKMIITGDVAMAAAGTITMTPYMGTGTAPAAAAALTGTTSGKGCIYTAVAGTAAAAIPFSIVGIFTVVPGKTYWIDLAGLVTASTGTLTNLQFVMEEV